MRSTADDVITQIFLDWLLGMRPEALCRAYHLDAVTVRALMAVDLAQVDREWRRSGQGLLLLLVCPGCGRRTARGLGMRLIDGRALCALCAFDELLGEVAG